MIQLKHLSKVYDNGKTRVEAIKDINLTVEDGDIFRYHRSFRSRKEYPHTMYQFSRKAH